MTWTNSSGENCLTVAPPTAGLGRTDGDTEPGLQSLLGRTERPTLSSHLLLALATLHHLLLLVVLVVLQAGEGPGGVDTAGRTGGALPALINILAGSPVLGELETLGTGAVGLALGTVATVGTLNITSGHLGIYYLVHCTSSTSSRGLRHSYV